MDKQCGNCKWWDVDHMETNDSLKFAKCAWAQNKNVPFFVWKQMTFIDDGRNCAAFTERKQ